MEKQYDETGTKPLTEAELRIMRVLWSKERATVHELKEELMAEKELAYTSISTIVRILEKKGFVDSKKEGRGAVYFPLISKKSYEKFAMKEVITQVFENNPLSLVTQLLENEKFKAEELATLKKFIEEKTKEV